MDAQPTWSRQPRIQTLMTSTGWIAQDPRSGVFVHGDAVVEAAWRALVVPQDLDALGRVLEACDDVVDGRREAGRILASLHGLGMIVGPPPATPPSPRVRGLAAAVALARLRTAIVPLPDPVEA